MYVFTLGILCVLMTSSGICILDKVEHENTSWRKNSW